MISDLRQDLPVASIGLRSSRIEPFSYAGQPATLLRGSVGWPQSSLVAPLSAVLAERLAERLAENYK